jgi:TonB-dependent starch-binding outer membrane protein SusC
VSGAIGTIKPSQLDPQLNKSLATSLQGRIAGLSIVQTGQPGNEVEMKIRGIGTINGTTPLYIIDGMPVGSLNTINPYDIESIEVMKDAAAAAIYGSRAANGVIIVTTKKDAKGKIKINVNADYGVQHLAKKMDLCNSDEWVKVLTEMYKPSGLTLPAIATAPQVTGKGTDWQDEIYRRAIMQNYSIGATGGGENLSYSASFNYVDQDGIQIKDNYKRYTFRFSSEFTKGRFKVGQSLMHSQELYNRVGSDMTKNALLMIPAYQIYNDTILGGYQKIDANQVYKDVKNPVATANLFHYTPVIYNTWMNFYAEVTILDGLKFKTDYSMTIGEVRDKNMEKKYNLGGSSNQNNKVSYGNKLGKLWQIENTLTYTKTIAQKHFINAMIGQTALRNNGSEFSASGEGMPDDIWELKSATLNKSNDGVSYANTLGSFLGRLIYSYDNRYTINGVFRRDGSSRFYKTNRWGNFTSVSGAWNVANESFFKNLNTPVTELKIRGSMGQLGNQEPKGSQADIDYLFYRSITSGTLTYTIGSPSTLWPATIETTIANTDLTWEKTTTKNIAVDFGLWNGKLTYSFDAYKKITTNMLYTAESSALPPSVGVSNSGNTTINVGKVTNTGYEMALTYNGHSGAFNYSLNGTFSQVKNTLNEMYQGTTITGGSGPSSTVTYTKPGYPVYGFFLIQTDGLFRSDAEIQSHSKDGTLIQPNAKLGDIRYKDADGDGNIDDNDRVYCGSVFPKNEFGLRIDGSWKFIDIGLFFQGVTGNKVYNADRAWYESGRAITNFSKDLLNSYTFNPNSNIPRLEYLDGNGNSWDYTDRWLEDGSYVRLKTLQIGFTLPESFAKKLIINRCRFYIAADNIATWTKYKGYQPDNGGGNIGIANGNYPMAKSYHAGIQLIF